MPNIGLVPVNSVAVYAYRAGFRGNNRVTIVAICGAESGYNRYAHALTSREDSRGLSQINVRAHPWGIFQNLYDPQTNLNAAYRVYREAGLSFRPWSTYTSGSYRNFWNQAVTAVAHTRQPGEPLPVTGYPYPPTDVPDDYSGHFRTGTYYLNNFAHGFDSFARMIYAALNLR